ncbi:HNH endonuclease signature motif containing protein [Nocardia sp. XZ_19_369]|uniref:HNH endonuclease signature motif containing protein n=1 Tax=Nocardia sp. XZ_19_369 TaxID=2769487 RepID=UPI00188F6634|nr:HNH endonuclease signature motif containing protein [Nocardia sp. XZ_19_369]
MSSSGEEHQGRVADPLLGAVADLLERPLTPMSDDKIIELLRDVEQATRRLVAVGHRLIVEASDRNLPNQTGTGTAKKFLMHTLRLSNAEAGARVAAALSLGSWHDMAGEVRAPRLPSTAAAQVDGEISADHARQIAAVMKRVPGSTANAEFEAAEQLLADFARTGSPDDIAKVGEAVLAYLDPDGVRTDDTDRARMRGITIGRQRADGMSPIKGEITPTLRALLDPCMAKLARPGMNNPDDPESPSGEDGFVDQDQLATAARRDARSAAQRTHDGFLALLRHCVAPEKLGAHRGLPVSTILTMNIADVEKAAGVATTATGGMVPISEALKLAAESEPFLMVFDTDGLPLHLGRTKRLASAAQRLALIAAVRGCSRPGCDAPASVCAIHHVMDWNKGGPTDIGNETLACDQCHALVHDGPGGWKTVVLGPESAHPGRVAWIGPPHINPSGQPQINNRHRPGELLAEALSRIHERKQHEENEKHERTRQEQRLIGAA